MASSIPPIYSSEYTNEYIKMSTLKMSTLKWRAPRMIRNETTLLTFLLFYGSLKNSMSKQIAPIKYHKVKQALLKGASGSEALLAAGYSKSVANHHLNKMTVYNRVLEDILSEMETNDITPKKVIANIECIKRLSIQKGDYSNATKCEELKGRWLAMFTDRQQIDMRVLSKEEQTIIAKYTDDVNVVNDVNITNDSNATNDTNTTNDSNATNDTIASNGT